MNDKNSSHQKQISIQRLALIIGPVVSVALLLFGNLDPQHPEVTKTAAVALLMAIWWITEAVPLAATALLPVTLFPILRVMKGEEVASSYFNHIIFLFMGGFIVALAMERWNLHKRIALKTILLVGLTPKKIILGFMIASWFLSMWISNTATVMMVVPIALAIITKLEDSLGKENVAKFSIGLLLGVAYASSIGGISTLIGTPPNLVFVKILGIYFPNAPEITFGKWFAFAFPISIVFLVFVWWLLTTLFCPRKRAFQIDLRLFRDEQRKLGSITFEERVVLIVFTIMVLLWFLRADIQIGSLTIPGWASLLSISDFVDDGTVAVTMALLLFIIPAKKSKTRIMDWRTATKLPWEVILLFGGGFALAGGFKESGLSFWIVSQLKGFSSLSPLLIVIIVCTMMTFLTELTSNTATAQVILPILTAVSISMKTNPLFLMVPATLSASCAFMLPVATPPNAIIFGTQRLHISDMARVGLLVNLFGIIIITIGIYFLGLYIFNIDLAKFPTWAVNIQ